MSRFLVASPREFSNDENDNARPSIHVTRHGYLLVRARGSLLGVLLCILYSFFHVLTRYNKGIYTEYVAEQLVRAIRVQCRGFPYGTVLRVSQIRILSEHIRRS